MFPSIDKYRAMTDRKLTKDDKEVWDRVAKTISPQGEPQPSFRRPPIMTISDVMSEIQSSLPKSKSVGPQRTLDLHGMTKNEAYKYLETQLSISKMRGQKCVEVITGRGHAKGGDGLGILKRKVPLWLEGVKFRSIVKSWKQTPGNEGSILVYLN